MNKMDDDRIRQVLKIPVEYAEVYVNATKQDVAQLMQRLIMDDDFRVQFNKNPSGQLRAVGITVDEATIERLKASRITEAVTEIIPGTQALVAAIVIVGVIVGVIAPPKPAE
jgi:ABC-type dipeptide/oligopeptide/nickel transport system permease component